MGSTRFRNPQALSSVLASLGTLQPQVFGFLNRIDPLVSASNYYIAAHVFYSASSAVHNHIMCSYVYFHVRYKNIKISVLVS